MLTLTEQKTRNASRFGRTVAAHFASSAVKSVYIAIAGLTEEDRKVITAKVATDAGTTVLYSPDHTDAAKMLTHVRGTCKGRGITLDPGAKYGDGSAEDNVVLVKMLRRSADTK